MAAKRNDYLNEYHREHYRLIEEALSKKPRRLREEAYQGYWRNHGISRPAGINESITALICGSALSLLRHRVL